MKHLLIIIIFSVSWQLFAQSDPDLDLGNVIIQGESSNLTDSVSYQRDFAFYNTVNSETELGFKPQFQPASILNQIPETGSKSAFQALGGIASTQVNAAFTQNEILNFSAEYDFNRIKKKWDQQDFTISWQPQFKDYEWSVVIKDITYNDAIAQTNISSYEFKIYTPSYSIESMIPFEFDIDFKLAYLTSDQKSNNENDLNLYANIAAHSADFNSHINAVYLNQAFSGFAWFGLNKVNFGRPQIWLGYDEIHLYPSISFDRSFRIASGMEIQFANLPLITKRDKIADFNDNFFQLLKSRNLQEKKQLNAFIALHNNYILPLNIFYNPQFIKDKRFYIGLPGGYYTQIEKDRFVHAFGADLVWKINEFEIENSVKYQYCDKEIYYEPKLMLNNSIARQYGSFFGDLEMNFLADRVDENEDEMEDYFQINFNVEYKFKANLAIFGYAENLLNTDYTKYSNIPEEGINLYVGCRYGF